MKWTFETSSRCRSPLRSRMLRVVRTSTLKRYPLCPGLNPLRLKRIQHCAVTGGTKLTEFGSGRAPHSDYREQTAQHFGGSTTRGNSENEMITLMPRETPLLRGDFTESPILRHIKTGLVVTADRLIVRQPQFLLFFIKVGHVESSAPIRHICEVSVGRILSSRKIMWAGILGATGFFFLASGGLLSILFMLLGLVLLASAAVMAWMARGLALVVSHAGGGRLRVDVDRSEFATMTEAASLLHRLIAGRATVPPGNSPPKIVRD